MREMQKKVKIKKGRLRGFVLKMFRLGWLSGTHFLFFLMKYIKIRVAIVQMLALKAKFKKKLKIIKLTKQAKFIFGTPLISKQISGHPIN